MKKTLKAISISMSALLFLTVSKGFIYAKSENQIILNKIEGKTSINASIYGDDLEKNMVNEHPSISVFTLNNNNVTVSGFINTDDKDTAFVLSGIAYKTYDNNIIFDAVDINNKYDVIFLCLEKKQEYNDYILHRDDLSIVSSKMGDYGIKIYLMEKGTRNISIIEGLNVEITNIESALSNIKETEYSRLNWFENCFEAKKDENSNNNIDTLSTHTTEYTYWGDSYYLGSSNVKIQMGIKLVATNDTPSFTNGTFFASKLELKYVIKASDPAYNNPARVEDEYRVKNVKVQASVGKGYYMQSVWWNGSGYGSIGASVALSLSVGISYGALGASISVSPNIREFQKDNWLNLVNSECDGYLKMPRKVETKYDNITLGLQSHYLDLSTYVVNNTKISEKFKAYALVWTFDVLKKGAWGYNSVVESKELYCTDFF